MDCTANDLPAHRDDVAQTRCYLASIAVFFNRGVASSAHRWYIILHLTETLLSLYDVSNIGFTSFNAVRIMIL